MQRGGNGGGKEKPSPFQVPSKRCEIILRKGKTGKVGEGRSAFLEKGISNVGKKKPAGGTRLSNLWGENENHAKKREKRIPAGLLRDSRNVTRRRKVTAGCVRKKLSPPKTVSEGFKKTGWAAS